MSILTDLLSPVTILIGSLFKKKPYRLWLWHDGKWEDHGLGSGSRLNKYRELLIKAGWKNEDILILSPDIKPIHKEGA